MLNTTIIALSVLSAGGPAMPRLTIAVAPFATESASEYTWVGPAIAQSVSARILHVPTLNGTSLRQVEAVIREENIDTAKLTDPANAVHLGKQMGANLIMVGSKSSAQRCDEIRPSLGLVVGRIKIVIRVLPKGID